MENAQLIGLSRQIALQRQMDVVANNIANINTTGFKSEQLLFEEYLMPVARDQDFAYGDQQLSFTHDWTTAHDMSGGALVETGNPLDVALRGDGFLVVETPAGERWTKSGTLQLQTDGTLVTAQGYPVLSEGGPITFGASETDIVIGTDGSISSSAGAKGSLRLVEFADSEILEHEGNNLYTGGTPLASPGTVVVQGSVEKSNVSGITSVTEMIRVQRSYESLTSMMQKQDEIRRSAIERLGTLNA